MSVPIEVEVRSLVSADEFVRLFSFFKENSRHLGEECQETHYLDVPIDLRIQKGDTQSKIWLKGGRIHDEAREEIEVHFPSSDFSKIEAIFSAVKNHPLKRVA